MNKDELCRYRILRLGKYLSDGEYAKEEFAFASAFAIAFDLYVMQESHNLEEDGDDDEPEWFSIHLGYYPDGIFATENLATIKYFALQRGYRILHQFDKELPALDDNE